MKIYTKIIIVFAVVFAVSCTKESDIEIHSSPTILLEENFDLPPVPVTFALNAPNWTSYAEQGTKLWLKKSFSGGGYATFSSFGSGQPNNVAWLISPEIDMDKQTGEKLYFESCQDGFIRSRENSLELYVSTDYDAVTFTNTSWEKLNFVSPTPDTTRFIYIPSGIIDLSSYKGKLRFALKIKGTNTLTGGYQVDKVKVFY